MAGLHAGGYDIDMHEPTFIATCASSMVIVSAFVGLRMYVRKSMTKSVGYDDWILLAATFLYFCHSSLLLAYSVNMKMKGVEASMNTSFMIFLFQGWVYTMTAIAVKGALAAFFMKVLPRGTWQRTVVYASVGLYSLFMFTQSWVFLFQCGNPNNILIPDPVCLDQNALSRLNYAAITINIIMDWLLTLMPITVIATAKMSSRLKLSVLILVALGALGSIISIMRLPFNYLNQIIDAKSLDAVQPLILVTMWENGVGIVAVSLAAMRPLMSKMTGGKWGTTMTTHTGTYTAGTQTKKGATATTATIEKSTTVVHVYENDVEKQPANF